MEVIRRNTDYALRAAIHLAANYGQEPVPAKHIAEQENISYQLACKLMQKLVKSGLVKSIMGSKGGYVLAKKPENISIGEIVNVVQGPIHLNKCMNGEFKCEKADECPINKKLNSWQSSLNSEFANTTLDDLVNI